MKKIISFSSSTLLLLSFLLVSCSKESPVTSQQNPGVASKIVVENNSARVNPANFGTISGVLSPLPIKASIIAYNDHYVSEETTIDQNGAFKLHNLPPDYYTVQINYISVSATDYLVYEVYKVIVVNRQDTNLGVITLPE